ncbi:sugar phosphotransferase [Streptomyces sp. NPDC088923]|uniref:sugar phosphotransferase n=1 Tax=Streptomyces sp. NPDC088923 TaxID=3365913 RepID=UPI003800C85F
MPDPSSLGSAARLYGRVVPRPLRSLASGMPAGVRRKAKQSLARTLDMREVGLHKRALRRLRRTELHVLSGQEVLLADGRTAHLSAGLTPQEARRIDHDLVTAALDSAGIPWFAVPALDDRRLCLAVESRYKGPVRRALRALLQEHTGYVSSVMPGDPAPSRIPGGDLSAWRNYGRARVFRVHWLRADPTMSLVLGEHAGVEIEFWTVNNELATERLVGPRPNRVQRVVARDTPRVELGLRQLSGYIADASAGSASLAPFDIPRLEDITFPVDAVVLWRDTAPWAEELLRAALRSLHQHAPWTGVVHVLAESPVPSWLAPGERLVIHRSGNDGALHAIPGLSEHFLLLRPGALLGRPVRPFDYFTPSGATRPRTGPWTAAEALAEWTARAQELTGRAVTSGYAHGPQPLCRTTLAELGAALPADPGGDGQTRDTLPTTHPLDGLAHHHARVTDDATPLSGKGLALHAAHPGARRLYARLLVRRDVQHLHLFGLGSDTALAHGGTGAALDFLRAYFPVPSPYESSPAAADTFPAPPGYTAATDRVVPVAGEHA